ncbi:hypothetical protein [Burkholderia sp. AU28863]|uniref:hypothetical protein n=1 Tax=Burkholderia sp. AU28863 TaxID=2015352 RepID=UPI0015C5C5FE|nr:hypothetical protein [Burkholderia sp. AU28863]
MDAHVEPRGDDREIVGKPASSAHGQLRGNSLGQLCGHATDRRARTVSVLKHLAHALPVRAMRQRALHEVVSRRERTAGVAEPPATRRSGLSPAETHDAPDVRVTLHP